MKEKNVNSKTAKPVKAKKAKAENQEKNADSLLVATKKDSTNVLAIEPDSLNASGDLDAHESATDGSNAVGDAAQNDAGMPALPTP